MEPRAWKAVLVAVTALIVAVSTPSTTVYAQNLTATLYPEVIPLPEPLVNYTLTIVYLPSTLSVTINASTAAAPSAPSAATVVASAATWANVTLLLAYSVTAPPVIETCVPTVSYTVQVYNVISGEPASITFYVYINGSYYAEFRSTNGVAPIYIQLPSGAYADYNVTYVYDGFVMGSTLIRYLNCYGGAAPGAPGVALPQLNLTPIQPPTITWPATEIAQPRLDTVTGVVVAGALLALWAWMARIDIAYATIVTGAVLTALGAVYNNPYMASMGAIAMVAGALYKKLLA